MCVIDFFSSTSLRFQYNKEFGTKRSIRRGDYSLHFSSTLVNVYQIVIYGGQPLQGQSPTEVYC